MPPTATLGRRGPAPAPRHHKPTGQCYVWLGGRRHYTGDWSDPKAHVEARRLLFEAAHHGGALPPPRHEATVAAVVVSYLEHAREYYGARPRGYDRAEQTLRPLVALFGNLKAVEFGPLRLGTLRGLWVEGGTVAGVEYRPLCRSTINGNVQRVVRVFKWAASRELVHPDVPAALTMVEGLRKGRSKAREPRKVHPVADAVIEATLPHLPRPVRGLVQLQRACGARSSEILGLRPRDIDMSGPVWLARLDAHKTAHLGKARVLSIGPKGQAVLREHMRGKTPWGIIFSPWDSVQERAEAAETHRRPNQKPNPKQTDRVVRETYDAGSYRRAISRAVVAANRARKAEGLPPLPDWHPHQLRHAFATEARRHATLDVVQSALGHASADMTEHYAALDLSRAAELASAIG